MFIRFEFNLFGKKERNFPRYIADDAILQAVQYLKDTKKDSKYTLEEVFATAEEFVNFYKANNTVEE